MLMFYKILNKLFILAMAAGISSAVIAADTSTSQPKIKKIRQKTVSEITTDIQKYNISYLNLAQLIQNNNDVINIVNKCNLVLTNNISLYCIDNCLLVQKISDKVNANSSCDVVQQSSDKVNANSSCDVVQQSSDKVNANSSCDVVQQSSDKVNANSSCDVVQQSSDKVQLTQNSFGLDILDYSIAENQIISEINLTDSAIVQQKSDSEKLSTFKDSFLYNRLADSSFLRNNVDDSLNSIFICNNLDKYTDNQIGFSSSKNIEIDNFINLVEMLPYNSIIDNDRNDIMSYQFSSAVEQHFLTKYYQIDPSLQLNAYNDRCINQKSYTDSVNQYDKLNLFNNSYIINDWLTTLNQYQIQAYWLKQNGQSTDEIYYQMAKYAEKIIDKELEYSTNKYVVVWEIYQSHNMTFFGESLEVVGIHNAYEQLQLLLDLEITEKVPEVIIDEDKKRHILKVIDRKIQSRIDPKISVRLPSMNGNLTIKIVKSN